MTPEEACLSEPLGVAIDMFKLADIQFGSHVLVSGLGPIGLMAVRLAKLAGAEKIYACDLSKATKRLELAKIFGADEIITVDKNRLQDYPFEKQPDRFMVSSPPVTLPSMIEIAAKGSIISYIGIKYGDGAKIEFDANVFHFKKLQLRGSFASPAQYIPMAINMIQKGIVDVKSLITHEFSLKNLPKAMTTAANKIDEVVKVVIKSM